MLHLLYAMKGKSLLPRTDSPLLQNHGPIGKLPTANHRIPDDLSRQVTAKGSLIFYVFCRGRLSSVLLVNFEINSFSAL